MKTASYTDTFDHMIGSGALGYGWWRGVKIAGAPDAEATPEWAATITAEDGDGSDKVVTFGHKEVLAAARKVIESPPEYGSSALLRECKHLIFDADETDFDANSADELLQFIVLGQIIYG